MVSKKTQSSLFRSPVRTLSSDEIVNVVGGSSGGSATRKASHIPIDNMGGFQNDV